jgi:spore maturation protein CgeB
VTDWWEGLDFFFTPGSELLIARDGAQVVAALEADDCELQRIARAGRERVLAEHTSDCRAGELLSALEQARRPAATTQMAEA